ncbi:hypothetical protein SEUCBS139899_009592 [Sporothrix eucalyptigena]
MSILKNLLKQLQADIASLESALRATGSLSHIFEAKPYGPLDDEGGSPPWPAFVNFEKIRLDLKAIEAAVMPTSKGGQAPLKALADRIGANEQNLAVGGMAAAGLTDNLTDPKTKD